METAFDVNILFLESTKYFTKYFFKEGQISIKDCFFSFKFISDGVDLHIWGKNIKDNKVFLNATLPEYDVWVKFIIKLIY